MDSTILQGAAMVPYGYDSLRSMPHAYDPFGYRDPGVIPWLTTIHAISGVTWYLSRAIGRVEQNGLAVSNSPGAYKSSQQTCFSTRPKLADRPGLYVVLAIQPRITLIALLVASILRAVPIGRRLGLSVLSGYDP